jgi:hypothetical protein
MRYTMMISQMKQRNPMKHMLSLFFSIFLIMTMVFSVTRTVHADDIPPDEVEIVTPVYVPEPGNFEPRFGQYTYSVSWQGIPAGTLELFLEKNGSDYLIKATARTNRFVGVFYSLRFNTEAIVSAVTFYPKVSVYHSQENKRRRNTRIEFSPDGEIRSVHEDRRGNIEKLQFRSNNFTLDPFSAAFLALSLHWEVGDTRQFDTFTGRGRYLVELTAIERTSLRIDGETREAMVISPRVQNLTKTDAPKNDDRLTEARIYVSTDPTREILRISSDVFVGSINTNLVSFSPAKNSEKASATVNSHSSATPQRVIK